MCGICGIVNFESDEPVDRLLVTQMAATLSHRGPDDEGVFTDREAGLGFRRLSIIDRSGGRQPIFNEDNSAVIVFNGEIYNYRDLGANLVSAGHIFNTKSDTETILHAYDQYGDDCVDHLRGMFGFAIWDRRKRRLLLARDRVGIKPVYYFHNHRFFAFASEIKALLEIPSISREVDLESFDQYLSLRYVPGPRTMFKNIFCLQPGFTLVVSAGSVRLRKYWDVSYAEPSAEPRQLRMEKFRSLLEESVRLRLMSEVPLGIFLSGGLDSSSILALASRFSGRAMKTFSVGYKGSCAENEFEFARLAAAAFQAEHYECRIGPMDFRDAMSDLVWHLDQPLADPACIPLYYVSKFAREHITVVLSGEGADEILAGYGIYRRMLALESYSRCMPSTGFARWLAQMMPSAALRRYLRLAAVPLETRYRGVSGAFQTELKCSLVDKQRFALSEQFLNQMFAQYYSTQAGASKLNRMLYVDAKTWLPDDLLLKADKMTMANGLELRVPFLDHKLIEFSASLPADCKLRGGVGKMLLRETMRTILPDPILDRPKKGFPVPLAAWLREPLREFTRDYLLNRQSAWHEYVESSTVTEIVKQHELGQADRSQEIWTLLVFEFWHRQFISNTAERSHVA